VTDIGEPVAGATVTTGKRQATTKAGAATCFDPPGSSTGDVTVTVTGRRLPPVIAS